MGAMYLTQVWITPERRPRTVSLPHNRAIPEIASKMTGNASNAIAIANVTRNGRETLAPGVWLPSMKSQIIPATAKTTRQRKGGNIGVTPAMENT